MGLDYEKNEQESTTITFRIKPKDKDAWQYVAEQVSQGNITRLIKRAVDTYITDRFGPVAAIREKGKNPHKYLGNLVRNLTQSNDPAVLRSKWDEMRLKLAMACIDGHQARIKRLQDELKAEIEGILMYRVEFD